VIKTVENKHLLCVKGDIFDVNWWQIEVVNYVHRGDTFDYPWYVGLNNRPVIHKPKIFKSEQEAIDYLVERKKRDKLYKLSTREYEIIHCYRRMYYSEYTKRFALGIGENFSRTSIARQAAFERVQDKLYKNSLN